MSLLSLPSTKLCSKIIPKSLPFKSGTKVSHNFPLNLKLIHGNLYRRAVVNGDSYSPLSSNTLVQRRFSSKQNRDENRGSGEEEDCRAMETVLNLCKALKNKNLQKLSEIIANECRCVCNFLSLFQFFHGKKQVLELFSNLMRSLGTNIEFVVQPTLHDGMNIGISWRLEWKETHLPLVKGFSFYTCHVYQGKLVIRNVEMVMESLLHTAPIRLKIMGYVMNALYKIGSRRTVHNLFILFFMAAWLFLS